MTMSLVNDMKVLLVGPALTGGGAERRFKNIAGNLFGGSVDIAVLSVINGSDAQKISKVIDLGWKNRLSYLKSIWLLRKNIKAGHYDVVMSFGLFPCVVSILSMYLLKSNTRIIISEITQPKMEAKNSKGWRPFVYNKLRKILYKRGSLITANSIDGLRETCELARIPLEKGVRVMNVVDTNQLAKNLREMPAIRLPKDNYIITVGRLDYMKRIDTVINAFDIIRKRIRCRLVIVGDGEAYNSLKNQVFEMGLGDVVIFTGKLENPFPVLRKASAYILASEYEGFSNSVIEAMFCDVPVITSFCSADAVEMCDQGAALGFEVGNVGQLADKITKVIMNESIRRSLVERARTYRSPHSMEMAIPFYENLIQRVARRTVFWCEDKKI